MLNSPIALDLAKPQKAHGERLSLFSLLQKHEVVIPIIQRDYAHGRTSAETVDAPIIRKRFLSALHAALAGNKAPLVLDYIYGATDILGRLLPIDGQQRLTTLYLLHWFFANGEGRAAVESMPTLAKFSYETRQEAADFCKSLVSNFVPLNNETLSASIKNSVWYHRSYDADPTVRAMLVMLDAIEEQFAEVKDGLANLCNAVEPPVSFWTLALNDFGLTDDLFIKMNARGKSLSDFENFKAMFEDQLRKSHDASLQAWVDKIDNDWIDAFWNVYKSKQQKATEQVEERLYQYIILAIELYYMKTGNHVEQVDEILGENATKYGKLQSIVYIADILNTADAVTYLQMALEAFLFIENKEPQMMDRLTSGGAEYGDKAKLGGYLEFYRLCKNQTIDEFVRLLQHLVIRQRTLRAKTKAYESTLDKKTVGAFLLGIESILKVFAVSGTLDDAICSANLPDSFKHEVNKARMRKLSPAIAPEISRLEDSPYLQGQLHNLMDGTNLLITRGQLDELIQEPALLLRCIMCFGDISEMEYRGKWKVMHVPDNGDPTSDEYWPTPYYIKFVGFSPELGKANMGDILLTRGEDDKNGRAVKAFLTAFAQLMNGSQPSPSSSRRALQSLLQKHVGNLSGLQYYFAKYQEFASSHCNVYGSMNKDGIDYSFRKCEGSIYSGRNYPFDYQDQHKNPFHTALVNIINQQKPGGITASYSGAVGVSVQEYDSILLSNGIKLCLQPDGNWKVMGLVDKLPPKARKMLLNNTTIPLSGDCIQSALAFIRFM